MKYHRIFSMSSGVLKSTDMGRTWRLASKGMFVTKIEGLFIADGVGRHLLCAVPGKVYESFDGADSWREVAGSNKFGTCATVCRAPTLDQQGSAKAIPPLLTRSAGAAACLVKLQYLQEWDHRRRASRAGGLLGRPRQHEADHRRVARHLGRRARAHVTSAAIQPLALATSPFDIPAPAPCVPTLVGSYISVSDGNGDGTKKDNSVVAACMGNLVLGTILNATAASWRFLGKDWPCVMVALDPRDASHFLYTHPPLTYRSLDNGQTKLSCNHSNIFHAGIDHHGWYYTAAMGGAFRSKDQGHSWEALYDVRVARRTNGSRTRVPHDYQRIALDFGGSVAFPSDQGLFIANASSPQLISANGNLSNNIAMQAPPLLPPSLPPLPPWRSSAWRSLAPASLRASPPILRRSRSRRATERASATSSRRPGTGRRSPLGTVAPTGRRGRPRPTASAAAASARAAARTGWACPTTCC